MSDGITPVTPFVPVPKDTTFSNPLLSTGADPWVLKKDTLYYYTNSSGDKIKLWRTGSISKLSTATSQTVWTKPASGANSQDISSPELHYLDGKWYIYYAAGSSADPSTQRIFVLENSSADPFTGSWSDKGKLTDPAADFFANDPTVFENNGKRYLMWSGTSSNTDITRNLYVAQLSNPYTMGSSRSLLSIPQYNWESKGASPANGLPAVNEAPQMLKNTSGNLFAVFSASGCWTDDYTLGILMLKDGGDPLFRSDWIKKSTAVFAKNTAANVYGPGHAVFFQSPDAKEDWMMFDANAQSGQDCGGTRSPRMQKFTWNTDGSPNLGEPLGTTTTLLRPSGEK